MAEICKKSKTVDEDLISRLPDEVLTHILSFISTKFAVVTSVLSKRWKLVWISVPNLEFDFSIRSLNLNEEKRKVVRENFIDRVLSLNKVTSVRNVKLYCRESDVQRANGWFESLVIRNAEKFDLSLPYFLVKDIISSGSPKDLNLLPDGFFNQKNLVELKLRNVFLKVPSLVCFPCLKTIKLYNVQLLDDGSMKNLLSGCPTLTHLYINLQTALNKQTLYICSSTLQKLESCIYIDDFDRQVVIDAPKLTCLKLEGTGATYDLINISSLENASIPRGTNENTLFELLRKMSHVKELYLDWVMLRKGFLQKLPMFNKLTHVTLEIGCKECLTFWLRFLDYTPNVVNIVFKLLDDRYRSWNEPLDLPQSILSCIESVGIIEENDQSLPVISCILKNATALKKLSFHGLPIHIVQEDNFLKTFLTASHNIKCRCAVVIPVFPRREAFCIRDWEDFRPTFGAMWF